MTLKDSWLKIAAAVATTAFAIVAFGAHDAIFTTLESYQKESAWLLIGSLVATYLISDRELNRLSNLELIALAIPALAVVGMKFVDPVNNAIVSNSPHSQAILILMAGGSVYILSEDY